MTRYDRHSPEFTRVANLSDAVFAIAMTLLVLTLDVPDVPAGRYGEVLSQQAPQLVVFVLAFGLVANWPRATTRSVPEHRTPTGCARLRE